jgi:hypothetical protein
MEDHPVTLTKKELKEVVAEGVYETFTQLGLDHENPLEMQRDFQYLRDWRVASEEVKSKGIMALLAILLSGAVAALWIGFKGILLS